MPIVFLLLTIVSATVQNFFTKIYSGRTEKGVFMFNALSTFFALLVFVVTAGFRFTFVPGVFLYSFAFALSYFLAVFGLTMAIKTGPLALTALIESYSMIVASVYGVVFLHDPVTPFMTVGFILLVISLTLINLEPKAKGEEKKSENGINLKWAIFVFIGFAGNGACTVLQKTQQVWSEKVFGEILYINDFMLGALFIALIAFIVLSLCTERKDMKEILSKGWAPAIGRGLSNGLANFFSILLYAVMIVSLANALIAAGCVVLAAIISVVIYKERLNPYQWAGLAVGIASLVFLNL